MISQKTPWNVEINVEFAANTKFTKPKEKKTNKIWQKVVIIDFFHLIWSL